MRRSVRNRAVMTATLMTLWTMPRCSQAATEPRRAELTGANAAIGALQHVRVSLAADSAQPTGTLRLAVSFWNDGDAAVELVDPRETTQVVLLDAGGHAVDVPRTSGVAVRVNRVQPPDLPVIRIEPRDEHRLTLDVARVHPPGDRTSLIPLPAGRYSVSVSTSVLPRDPSTATGRTLTSPTIDVTVENARTAQ
jgi:hypothetical protein